MKRSITTPLAPLLQRFFVERLQRQRQASPRTVAAYRDCFRLLLAFAKQKLRKEPADLAVEDLNVTMILDFLQHLEKQRKNRVTSRNARFAAIRSFMKYASFEEPAVTDTTRTVLAIPMKRTERPLVGFLSREQVEAIVAAPDTGRWFGRRDRVLLATLYNTGARVSEATGIQVQDLILDGSPAIRLHGKGRKERSVPIWPETAKQLRQWLREQPHTATSSVFPNRAGGRLSRTTVAERLQLAVRIAAARHPELLKKRISPHIFGRHSIAMHLLQSGVDPIVISLWLGHESPNTTHWYVEADLAMKERALKNLQAPELKNFRYRPSDSLLSFLQAL